MVHVGARKYFPGMGPGPAEVQWLDDEDLEFGSGTDVTVKWNSTDSVLEFLPLTNDVGAVRIGNGTLDMDFQVIMGVAAASVLFDNSLARVIFEQADLRIMDTDILEFGDDADVTLTWDGDSLNILPLGDDVGAIEIGNGTLDIDLKIFLGTAGENALFDVGNSCVTLTAVPLNLAGTFTATPLFFDTVVLPADTNVIRGVGLDPTRTSGWLAFQGSLDGVPAVCYPAYFQLNTTGVAEILGIASFMEMSAGASCKTLWGAQYAAYVANGATVLTAAAAPTIGVFSMFLKTTLNNPTFNAGAVAAALMLSIQVNVIDVTAEIVSLINCEIVGRISSVMYIKATGGAAGALYMFDIPDNIGEPAQSGSGSVANVGTSGWIKVRIGGLDRYIPLGDGAA